MASGSAQFGSSTSTILTDSEGLCSVNPSTSSIGPPDGESSPTVTLAITFNGATSGAGYTIESEWTDSGYDGMSNWGNLGNWTTSTTMPLTVQLTDLTQTSSFYLVGDSYSITVTGPPTQPVTVSVNGAAPIAAVNTQGSSSTNGQGVWTTTGTWGLGDIGNYTQTYYVAGVQVPGLSFQVSNGATRITCGPTSAADVGQGTQEPLSVRISTPPGSTPQVLFSVTGSNVNPYSTSVSASSAPNSSLWSYQLATGSLLGEYEVNPSVQLLNADGSVASTYACPARVAYFNVRVSSPANSGPAKCASMTGTWSDFSRASSHAATWNITDTSGSLGGTASYTGACSGTPVNFAGLTGSYSPVTQAYSMTATGPSPTSYSCGGNLYEPQDLTVKGVLAPNSCGLGAGTYSDDSSTTSDVLTTERVPAGETTQFAGWADQYGSPTTAMFNAMLNTAPNGPAYDFGGRNVNQGAPATPPGSDSCWWQTAPALGYAKITSLSSLGRSDPWNVQDDHKNGSYGIDYIGLGDTLIALIQLRSTALLTSTSSCTIQFPQQMSINSESSTGNDPPYATNMIVFTITQTTVSVSRASVTDPNGPRSAHF